MDYKTIIRNIAENLKELRKRKNITQEELIKEIGEEKISLRSYKSYENDKSTRVPQLDKISILANYFNCSLDYIVFGKKSVYSDSFLKVDNLNRLVNLIYSMVLIPVKETDANSQYCNKYYFYSWDEDVSVLMDKLMAISREKNNLFKYKGNSKLNMLDNYYKAIEDIQDLDIDWSPSIDRVNQILLESGINPEDYYKKDIANIGKSRQINKLNKRVK